MERTPLRNRVLPDYTRGEEIFNMVTHIVGGTLGFPPFCGAWQYPAIFLNPVLGDLKLEYKTNRFAMVRVAKRFFMRQDFITARVYSP